MLVLIVRHGIAEDLTQKYQSDADRELTAEGIKKMKKGAEGLKKIIPKMNKIISSPYLRAKQTAQILCDSFQIKELTMDPRLEPNCDAREVFDLLKTYRFEETPIAIVAHEPILSDFISVALSGNSRCFVQIKKGGMCLLEFGTKIQPGCALLHWYIKPSELRLIESAH